MLLEKPVICQKSREVIFTVVAVQGYKIVWIAQEILSEAANQRECWSRASLESATRCVVSNGVKNATSRGLKGRYLGEAKNRLNYVR
jgi:hypothetical protein